MNKLLKYDFYHVEMPRDCNESFEDVLNRIYQLEGRLRLDNSGEYPVRLQHLENGAAYILGDVARIRMNDIPDKMKLSGETAPIDLDDDEGLGEVTTLLYHPTTKILMFMRNRYAVSASGLGTYIENIQHVPGIQFTYILQEEAYRRLDRLTTIQRVDLEVAGAGNGAIFRELGLSPPAAADLMGVSPKVRLAFAFSTGYDRERSLTKRVVEQLVTAIRRRPRTEVEDVSMVVSGRQDNLQKEVIDLFEDILTDTIEVNIRNQRKITDEQRHGAARAVWGRHSERLTRIFGQQNEQ